MKQPQVRVTGLHYSIVRALYAGICATAMGLSISTAVLAQTSEPVTFDIPAQPLTTALKTFAEQAGMQLLYRPEAISGVAARPLQGQYDNKRQALLKLLEGSNLEVVYSAENAATIRPRAKESATKEGDTESAAAAYDFDIPSQDLGAALEEFIRITRQHVDFDKAHVRKKTSAILQGTYTADGGIEMLLRWTGLTARRDSRGGLQLIASVPSVRPSVPVPSAPIELEKIVVTGSRIRRTEREGPQPLIVATRDDIQRSGQNTIANFLNTLPEVVPGSVGDGSFSAYSGTATVQLRGLPYGTTLVLLNGRRAASSAASDGSFFNLNNIPAAAVERIEILPQGSSAIYGSDALAGVVNIILRENFDGLEADARYGHADGTDDITTSLAWGSSWERGSLSLIGTYYKQTRLAGTEREETASSDFTRFGGPDLRVTTCNPGNVYSMDGDNLPGLSFPLAAIPGMSGTPTIEDFQATAGMLNRCSNSALSTILSDTERVGFLASGMYRLTPTLELFSELIYSRVKLHQPFGPRTLSFITVPASNPFNPFGEDVLVDYQFAGDNSMVTFDYDTNFLRLLLGLRGRLFGAWEWELAGWIARDDTENLSEAFLDPGLVEPALASTDPNTALNLFTSGPPASRAVLDSFFERLSLNYLGETRAINVVLRGPLFDSPAGAVQAAFGAEVNRDVLEAEYDPKFSVFDYSVSRDVRSVFAEVHVPLLESANRPGIAEVLSVTGALRYDEYYDFGSATTPQFGIEWRPGATLLIRGAYAEAFRAPSLFSLYFLSGTIPAGFVTVSDPIRGEIVSPEFTYGGNPDLKPELGESRSLGIVWASERIRGLEASLTWWQVNQSDRITLYPGLQLLVDNEAVFPARVTRGPDENGQSGPILRVDYSAINLGELEVAGFDFALSYELRTDWGEWAPNIRATEYYRNEAVFAPNAGTVDLLEQLGSPRWRGTAALGWRRGAYSANLAGRYVGEYRDPLDKQLGDFWVWDLNARYEIGIDLAADNRWLAGSYLVVGVVDAFDHQPKFSPAFGAFDTSQHDLRGRYLYAQLGLRF